MPPREPAVFGPRTLVDDDVAALNQVFADAFTDRYRRDGMVGVRVPRLNPAVWRYALRDSGDGAMVWTDHDDKIAAFNVENLFDRARAFNLEDPDDGQEVIQAVAELNSVFEEAPYTQARKQRILEIVV